MNPGAANGEVRIVDGSARQALRRIHGGRRGELFRAARRNHGLPRPQRRGEIDLDPDAVRAAAPDCRPSGGGGHRCRPQPGERAREYRLHVAEIFALQRPFGRRESALLWRDLWGERSEAHAARRIRDRNGRARRTGGRAGFESFRRLEAAPGARLRGSAPAADPLPRRADVGGRPVFATAILGSDLRALRGRGDRPHHHPLHGRGGILQPHRPDQPRAPRRIGDPERTEAQRDPGAAVCSSNATT